jgi:NADH-quinone oxidoreductase subunit L
LGAGAIIHAMHHEEEMGNYGGLRKKLPFTFTVMLIGCLAIAGVPPFAGFFSKDLILASVFESGNYVYYAMGLITSGITAFYMFRMLFLTFFGKPRDHHTYDHAHEGPWMMNLPLLLLATGSTVVGFFGLPAVMGGSMFAGFLAPSFPEVHAHEVSAQLEYTLMALAVIAGGLGITIAWVMYGEHSTPQFKAARNWLLRLFSKKYFFDEIYGAIFNDGLRGFSKWGIWNGLERFGIDGMANGLPKLYSGVASAAKYLQTGAVRTYAYLMIVSMIAGIVLVMSLMQMVKL